MRIEDRGAIGGRAGILGGEILGDDPFDGVFAITDRPRLDAWRAGAAKLADGTERCRVEAIDRGGEKRYLVHNWRREPRSAPKRLLL